MLENYKKAFKAYDIRALYGKEIDKKFTYTLWKAVGEYINQQLGKESKFLIACDVREANNELINYFVEGLQFSDFYNIDFAAFRNEDTSSIAYPYGVCSTSISYFLWQWDYDLSVNFTASHNPAQYVGMKFFDKEVWLIDTSFLREIFQKHYQENVILPDIYNKAQVLKPEINNKKEELFEFLNQKRDQLNDSHDFIIDFSTWAWVSVEKEYFQNHINKKHKVSLINDKPDGTFSAHESETQDPNNYIQLIQKTKEKSAEFGIMFDGDVDRIGFVTQSWQIIKWDILTAIIAKQILKENLDAEKKLFLYEVMSSKIIPEMIEAQWWETLLVRIGRFFINKELRKSWWLFAGELSWHFLFPEIWYYEMPLLAIYYLIKELENHKNADEMVKEYQKYPKCPVIDREVKDKEATLQKIKKTYKEYSQKYIDGVSVFANNFRFNVRASNTSDKIRFTVEADNEEILDIEVKKLTELIEMG